MSRARSFCRQEAGAAGDDLPARIHAARLLARRERAPRTGDGSAGKDATTEGMIERNGVATRGEAVRVYTGLLQRDGHVRRAEAASHFEGESRIQPPRMCLHVPREGGGGRGSGRGEWSQCAVCIPLGRKDSFVTHRRGPTHSPKLTPRRRRPRRWIHPRRLYIHDDAERGEIRTASAMY